MPLQLVCSNTLALIDTNKSLQRRKMTLPRMSAFKIDGKRSSFASKIVSDDVKLRHLKECHGVRDDSKLKNARLRASESTTWR